MHASPKKFALIGYPLGHSFSPVYFKQKFEALGLSDYSYVLHECETLENLLYWVGQESTLAGFNVTIPHKTNIMQYLDQITADARDIGAVNTVKIVRSAGSKPELHGYNTDAWGFAQSIKPFLHFTHSRALVLGTGGASRAVVHVLKQLGVEVLMVSRNPQGKNVSSWDMVSPQLIKTCPLIINTTPLGMHPNSEIMPAIPYEAITDGHFLIDLVYNPEETLFLKKGKEKGAIVLNGIPMLHLQADKAWEIWNAK